MNHFQPVSEHVRPIRLKPASFTGFYRVFHRVFIFSISHPSLLLSVDILGARNEKEWPTGLLRRLGWISGNECRFHGKIKKKRTEKKLGKNEPRSNRNDAKVGARAAMIYSSPAASCLPLPGFELEILRLF